MASTAARPHSLTSAFVPDVNESRRRPTTAARATSARGRPQGLASRLASLLPSGLAGVDALFIRRLPGAALPHPRPVHLGPDASGSVSESRSD